MNAQIASVFPATSCADVALSRLLTRASVAASCSSAEQPERSKAIQPAFLACFSSPFTSLCSFSDRIFILNVFYLTFLCWFLLTTPPNARSGFFGHAHRIRTLPSSPSGRRLKQHSYRYDSEIHWMAERSSRARYDDYCLELLDHRFRLYLDHPSPQRP